MVDQGNAEHMQKIAEYTNAPVWTFLIQTNSGSYEFAKYSPTKERHFFLSEELIDKGTPVPEETGLNINENTFMDDLVMLAKNLGINIPPPAQGEYIVKHLEYNDARKVRLAPFRQPVKQTKAPEKKQPIENNQPTGSKPWWKIW